jgi:hypothetical protein
MSHVFEYEGVTYGRDEPLFEMTEEGDVLCTYDGRPATGMRQTLAEQLYWMEVGWGRNPNLIHAEEAQAFYTQGGELALSRDYVHLWRLMGERHKLMSVCRRGIKADGGRCKAQAMRGSSWCLNHDPDKSEERRRRASKGGKRGEER